MRFVAGVIDIGVKMPEIRAEADKISDLVLVIVDTGRPTFPAMKATATHSRGHMLGCCGN